MSKYQIISMIGKGGMGTVYKAKHEKIEKFLAIKVLSSEIVNSKPARKRFEQEIQAVCNLTDPHLVSVYDFGITDKGAPFLVMDYIDGVTLSEEIKALGTIRKERALDIFIQLCEAMSHAHERGILHRDLKPSNIMITEDGNKRDFVKVVDFGLAKVLPSSGNEGKTMTSTNDVVGSPFYMSPEQCMGEQLDQRADIYAIGCVMHEVLVGKPPFSKGNTVKIIFQHINADRGSLIRKMRKFKLGPGLEHVVLRCLEKKPKDRYQTISDLLKDLYSVQKGQRPVWFLSRRKTEQLALAGTAFLSLTILALVFFHPTVAFKAVPNTAPVDYRIYSAPAVLTYPPQEYVASTPVSTPLPEPPVPSAIIVTPTQRHLAPAIYPPIERPQHAGDNSPSPAPAARPIHDSYRGELEILELSANDTLTLESGIYHLSKLKVSGNASIKLHGGPVTIVVRDQRSDESSIEVTGNASINQFGNPNLLRIEHIGDQPVILSGNAQVWGTINPVINIQRSGNARIIAYNSREAHGWRNNNAESFSAPSEKKRLPYTGSVWQYREEVSKKIQGRWMKPLRDDTEPHYHSEFVMLDLSIDSSGNLSDLRVINPSGDQFFDNSAIGAVRLASPFPIPQATFPSKYSVHFNGDSVNVN